MTNSTIISTGDTYRVFGSAVQTHNTLPHGTYKIAFDPMSGYSLLRVEPLAVGANKVYGKHHQKLDRIALAYKNMDRSLGVLMSGDKGMGKSLMVRLVSEYGQNVLNMPVVLVDHRTPGIADFIDSLGECVVVFDEFEKKFPARGDEDSQAQFLSLLDGVSTAKRLYVMTVNKTYDLNDYFINRPGRFHYHIRFDYPNPDEVREYLQDQAPTATAEAIEEVVRLTFIMKMNYDHLRAVAFELELGGNLRDVLGDLNISHDAGTKYTLTVTLSDGSIATEIDDYNLSSSESQYVEARGDNYNVSLRFDPSLVEFGDEVIKLPLEALSGITVNPRERSGLTSADVQDVRKNIKVKAVSLVMRPVVRVGF